MNVGRFVGYFVPPGAVPIDSLEWPRLQQAAARLGGSIRIEPFACGAGGLAVATGTDRPGACRDVVVHADGGFALIDGVIDEINGVTAAPDGDSSAGAAAEAASPAALVLAAHRRCGPATAERLFGDCVVIAWHPGAALMCAVSPGGGRWLYFRASGRTLWFADHPELLLDSDRPRGDRTYFSSLAQGYLSGERTPFEGVSRLRPGYALAADGHGIIERRFWRVPRSGSLRYARPAQYHAQLRQTLEAAVRRHMRGHQRVCISLSAGVDSGAVAACAGEVAAQTGVELLGLTFSTPDDPLADEGPAASRAAARLGLRHRAVTVDDEPAGLAGLLEMASRLPFPTGHVVYARPLAALAGAAAEWGATLLLNGAGGELHSGSFEYLLTLFRDRRYARLAGEILRWRARGFSLRRQLVEVVAAMRDAGAPDGGDARKPWLRLEPVQPPADRSAHPMLRDLERFLTQEAIGSEMHQALYAAHGVATGAPHLDRRVIEFVLATPLELRLPRRAGDLNKPLLRSAFPEISDDICLQGDRVNLGEHAAHTWIRCAASDGFPEALFDQPSPLFDDILDRARLRGDLVRLRQSSEEMGTADVVAAAIWLAARRDHGVSLT